MLQSRTNKIQFGICEVIGKGILKETDSKDRRRGPVLLLHH